MTNNQYSVQDVIKMRHHCYNYLLKAVEVDISKCNWFAEDHDVQMAHEHEEEGHCCGGLIVDAAVIEMWESTVSMHVKGKRDGFFVPNINPDKPLESEMMDLLKEPDNPWESENE